MREPAGCTVRLGRPVTAAVQRLTFRCLSLSCLLDPKWRQKKLAAAVAVPGASQRTHIPLAQTGGGAV